MYNIIDRSITHYNTIIIHYLLFHQLIHHDALCYSSASLPSRSFPWRIKREPAPVAPAAVEASNLQDEGTAKVYFERQAHHFPAASDDDAADTDNGADNGTGPL